MDVVVVAGFVAAAVVAAFGLTAWGFIALIQRLQGLGR